MRAAGLAFVGVMIVASCTDDGSAQRQAGTTSSVERTTSTATGPATTTNSTSPPTTTPPQADTATTIAASISTTSPTTVPVEGVRRPILDPTVCETVSAHEGTWTDLDLRPFARSSGSPVPLQLIADPDLGFDGPFALLLRFPDGFRGSESWKEAYQPVETGSGTAWVTIHSSGSAEAIWDLPDESEAYIRGLGFDLELWSALVAGLSPAESPTGSATPAFEFDPAAGRAERLSVLAQGISTGANGFGRRSECQTDTHIHRIGAVGGDPLFVAAAVLDQPAPHSVGVRGDTVLYVATSRREPHAPTVDDIIEAEPALWTELLDAPTDIG